MECETTADTLQEWNRHRDFRERVQEHLDRIRAKFAKRGEAIKDNRIYRKLRRLDDDGPCQRERNRPDVWPIVALPLNRGLAPTCFQHCPRI